MSAELEASPNAANCVRWIAEARGGSRAALDQLLKACSRYLLAVAKRELCAALRSRLDPVDVVQDALMKAWRHFPRFRGQSEGEWLAWLRQILRRNLANERRQHIHRAVRGTCREVALTDHALMYLPDSASREAASPVGQVLAQERHKLLDDALRRLPAHYRQVLLLRTQEELTFTQVGEQLHCTADAARKLWRRAIDQLAWCLGDSGQR